jgi:hypothetical protein
MLFTPFILIGVCLLLITSSWAYLPGVAPHNFRQDEQVDLKVNKLRLTVWLSLRLSQMESLCLLLIVVQFGAHSAAI